MITNAAPRTETAVRTWRMPGEAPAGLPFWPTPRSGQTESVVLATRVIIDRETSIDAKQITYGVHHWFIARAADISGLWFAAQRIDAMAMPDLVEWARHTAYPAIEDRMGGGE